ncbi:MAG: tetratricopeptide repeat protein [Pyrinomonadaceae bacterium]
MPKAKEAVARALEIDDTLSEAHASLGLIRHMYDWDWAGAEFEFKRAIELNPNSSIAHELYAKCLGDWGRFDESIPGMRRTLELDPFSVGINKEVGETLFYARRIDEAIAQWQKTLALEPNYSTAHSWLARAYWANGLYDQAIDEYLKQQSARGATPERIGELKTLSAKYGWKPRMKVEARGYSPSEMNHC